MTEKRLEYSDLHSTSVVDGVKDWIIDQIISGTLNPGDKIPTEAELCLHLGIGRNSIREAIKQLEAQGVLYIKRAEGTFISDSYDPKMLSPILYNIIMQKNGWSDFVDLRKTIDIGSLFVVAEKGISEEGRKKLKKSLTELEDTIADPVPDIERIVDSDCNFHNTIVELTKNPQLKSICDIINRLTVPSRIETTKAVIAAGNLNAYVKLHRQLYDIIVNRNKAGIEEAVTDHYVYWNRI